MSERLTFNEISNLFDELASSICIKDDFLKAKRAWSSHSGKKLANSKNPEKRSLFNTISKNIRILDHDYEPHLDIVYKKFMSLADDILPKTKMIDCQYRYELESESMNQLNICPKLTKRFITKYKKSKKITFSKPVKKVTPTPTDPPLDDNFGYTPPPSDTWTPETPEINHYFKPDTSTIIENINPAKIIGAFFLIKGCLGFVWSIAMVILFFYIFGIFFSF